MIDDDPYYEERAEQILSAQLALLRPERAYLRWPWPALQALYGGMAPGTVHYVVGYSGIGKTTFIASAIKRWRDVENRRIDVLPLEINPGSFRTQMACHSLDINPGPMLSGDFLGYPDAAHLRLSISNELHRQDDDDRVRVHSCRAIDVAQFRQAVEGAVARRSDVVIVDHIDHIAADGNGFDAAKRVNHAALRLAEDNGICMILMSQANSEALKGSKDRLAKYLPLHDNHVWMGQVKRQVATGMLSLYRPVRERRTSESPEDYLDAYRRARVGDNAPHEMLMPGTGGISLMKSRNYGDREGMHTLLTLRNGLFVEHEPIARSMM